MLAYDVDVLCRQDTRTRQEKLWCKNSQELQGIRLERPDQRHKSLVLVNTYIHPGAESTKASWDFLEQTEDELEDTAVMYDDFNGA